MTLESKMSVLKQAVEAAENLKADSLWYTFEEVEGWTLFLKDGDGDAIVELTAHPTIEDAVDHGLKVVYEQLVRKQASMLILANTIRSIISPLSGPLEGNKAI